MIIESGNFKSSIVTLLRGAFCSLTTYNIMLPFNSGWATMPDSIAMVQHNKNNFFIADNN
ncbi:MAG: hypothetical protein BGP13_03585 [Sphingobacteriales bacterium 40-81]|nr:MAG: hypothetical protein BGP13_03585 [Sphingobacteriales bacterium 40-81]